MSDHNQQSVRYRRLLARYFIACLLLFLVFRAIPFEQAWRALRAANIPTVGLAVLLLAAARWLGAVRTRGLLDRHGMRFPTLRLFALSCVATLYGLALPGSLSGGIVRWYRIGQPNQNYSVASSVVVFERVIAFAVLALLGLVGWVGRSHYAANSALGWMLAAAFLLMLVLGVAIVSLVPARIAEVLRSLPLDGGWLSGRLRSAAIRGLEAMSRFRDASSLLTAITLSIAVHLVATAGFLAMATALRLDVGYAELLWIRAGTIAITTVPLTPSGLGVREGVSVLLLGMVGVSAASAVAFSMLQFAMILFFAALGALFEYRHYLLPTDTEGSIDDQRVEASNPTNAAGPTPSVALIVLNYQRKDLLLQCLEAASATLHASCQIVVVDNGSTDGSADAAERAFPDAIVLRNEDNQGVAGGRNVGACWVRENLGANYLVFIDNDTLLEPESIGELVRRCADDPSVGLVAPKAFRKKGDRVLLSAGGLKFNPYTGVLHDVASGEIDDGNFNQPRYVQACPGFAFLVRRDVFDRVGFFDEHFNPYGWEDADFSLRASGHGYRIAYAPMAVVYHLGGRAGRGAVIGYEYHKARSMFYFVRRHTNLVQWLCFCLVLPVRALVRIGTELSHQRLDIVRVWMSSLGQSRHGKDG
ncbi:MAG: flippase-like domain-containing protein [Gammaproteobacteria bacterium]|nr:flippase-like domain-containing protein [Gammaproteobacteria bacterium]